MSLVPEVGVTGLGALDRHLAGFATSVALTDGHVEVTYGELAGRVRTVADRLGTTRRLVLVEAGSTVAAVAGYLGALAGGHVVLLTDSVASSAGRGLQAAYAPDAVLVDEQVTELRPGTAHDLHPDLALLLSTSGSTGSPKLVRLSRANLIANATAIADYLALRPDDRAATSLPMHYCYGLSVLHSHLLVGASLLLTDRSVSEPEFWTTFAAAGATSLAGVPYTFELLDRAGFADLELPRLRYLTQAGGRMAPEVVRRYAELGRRRGFDLFVMYGQTEATARMAYLPPDQALTAPAAVGVPIPGGGFRLDTSVVDGMAVEPGVGELVYSGANVMMGYAETPADLALGPQLTELRTGDLGRRRSDGLYEITGRRSRLAKVYGLRIDLDRVERLLATAGVIASVADGGDALAVGVCAGARPVAVGEVLDAVRRETGLPPAGVRVVTLPELPRLSSGKPDYAAIAAEATTVDEAPTHVATRAATEATPEAVRSLYAELLGRPDASVEDSFVTLGGDSLSYVESSLSLERILGDLPQEWPRQTAAELASYSRTTHNVGRRGRRVETNLLLRAFAIVSIVGTHANLWTLLGGAHLLLAVAGFNFARFQLTDAPRRERVLGVLRSVGRIVLPAVVVISTVSLWTPGLGWRQALLLNGLSHRVWSEPQWYYWFVEAIVYILLFLALVCALPWVDRMERRHRFWLPFALAVVALVTRFGLVGEDGDQIHRAHVVFWLFALGWASARAGTPWQRCLLTMLALASVPGFFSEGLRDLYVLAGLLALIWVARVRVPAFVGSVAGPLAAASLWIYLVHWQVYPFLEYRIPILATLLSLGAGVLAHLASLRLASLARSRGHPWRAERPRLARLTKWEGGEFRSSNDGCRLLEHPARSDRSQRR